MLTRILPVAVIGLMLVASSSHAHFPWLSSDEEGRALLFFNESPHAMDYRMPEVVGKAEVLLKAKGDEPQPLELEAVETKEYVGRKSQPDTVSTGVLTTTCNYGNYHGTLLIYYVKHYAGNVTQAAKLEADKAAKGFAIDARPSLIDKGIAITVTRDGKPVADASVMVATPDGENADKKTGKDGVAKFYNLAEGKLGFTVGVTDKKEGEVDGEKYTTVSNYLTLTVDTSAKATEEEESDEKEKTASKEPPVPSALKPLPEAVTSFGAAVADDYVYVYSGHTGKAHAHSKEHYSRRFVRMPLAGGEWQELPMQDPVQGLALVPHEGRVYRVGGVFSHNAQGEDEDMHSVDKVAVFDPASKEWSDLPSMPTARSSHDAVVIDGVLYVVGGWSLEGTPDGVWSETALKLNLEHPEEGWQELPQPPFVRRALAASHVGNTLVVMGGIDEAGAISRQVDALDLESGEWRTLPELPGDGMQGFGVSAWNHEGKLYVSGSSGIVYTLSDDLDEWQEVAKHADKRFFHRLLPAGEGRLLMIGGASMKRQSHVADSEWVKLDAE